MGTRHMKHRKKNEIKDELEFQKSHDKAIGSRGMLIFKK